MSKDLTSSKDRLDHQAIDGGRRQLAIMIPAMFVCGAGVLAGCAKASSAHGGRRTTRIRSSNDLQPLQFDVGDGFNKLNSMRRNRLLPAFKMDPRLQKAAQDYANLMGSRGLYGHEIGPGTDFKSRIFAVGYDNTSGENLGVGYGSIDEAIKGWLNSPGHKKNMLRSNYRLAGLAYGFNHSGKNSQYTHLWVLIMGVDDGYRPYL